MKQYLQLVKRNILIYLRDKGAVFFSLLSMIVVLCLTVFFLGDVNITALTEKLALLPNRDEAADKQNAFLLIACQQKCGCTVVYNGGVFFFNYNLHYYICDFGNLLFCQRCGRFIVNFTYKNFYNDNS